MSVIGTLAAVRARLQGQAPSYIPSYPKIEDFESEFLQPIDNAAAQADVQSSTKKNWLARLPTRKVPIVYFDVPGMRNNLIYPSLTYEVISYTPRYTEYAFDSPEYGGEDYIIPITESAETVLDGDEDLGEYPRIAWRRSLEHPMDITIEIRAYAKDPLESLLLVQYVYGAFEPRGYMRVPMHDGSYASWDLMFEDFKDLDKREAVDSGAEGVVREYAKVWTYKLEGYVDNTELAVLENLVRKRTLTVGAIE